MLWSTFSTWGADTTYVRSHVSLKSIKKVYVLILHFNGAARCGSWLDWLGIGSNILTLAMRPRLHRIQRVAIRKNINLTTCVAWKQVNDVGKESRTRTVCAFRGYPVPSFVRQCQVQGTWNRSDGVWCLSNTAMGAQPKSGDDLNCVQKVGRKFQQVILGSLEIFFDKYGELVARWVIQF